VAGVQVALRVAALSSVYPFFLSWMVTGESKTLAQLDPKDSAWFQKLLDSLAEKDAKVVLNMYADSIYQETTGLEPNDED
jgi:hypothetical protein